MRAVFSLLDADGDGALTEAEIARYLRSVYAVLRRTDAGVRKRMDAEGVGAAELAAVAAHRCFEDMTASAGSGTGGRGGVSWREFRDWYSGSPVEGTILGQGAAALAKIDPVGHSQLTGKEIKEEKSRRRNQVEKSKRRNRRGGITEKS